MVIYDTLFDLYKNVLTSFGEFWGFLTTPLDILGLEIAPIFIFTGAGIIAYIVLAISFWIIK